MTHFALRIARRMDPILQLGNAVRVDVPQAAPFDRVHVRQAEAGPGWKRMVDIALSCVALVLVSPLMLATAALVKLTSRGPVFFTQERIGLERRAIDRRREMGDIAVDRRDRDRRVVINPGRPFRILKFRTMVADAERGAPVWARREDPRITPLGRVLRKTRVDELPQFLNVLAGDMSIVGPRPERAYFIGRIEKQLPEFQLRLRTKPGITGLAQVELGYTNTDEGLHRKLDFDLEYIRRLSLSTDVKILFKTIHVVLTGKGAC